MEFWEKSQIISMESANATEKTRHILESKQTVLGFGRDWKVNRLGYAEEVFEILRFPCKSRFG